MHELKKTIKRMVKAGELAWGPSHLVCSDRQKSAKPQGGVRASRKVEIAVERADRTPKGQSEKDAARDSKHFTGTFRRAAGGFGFVRPEGTQRAEGRDADVFIPADKTGDAANGDIVSVRLESKRGRMGKQEGRIIDVVERATNRFVGVYFEQAGMGMVQIDGKIFGNAIYVGDPGAKGVRPDDKVVIEMVRFPSHAHDGEGVVVEVLGRRGQPGVDTMSIIYEFNLPGEFDDDVLDDSRKQAELFDESIASRPPRSHRSRRSSRSTRSTPATSTMPSRSNNRTTATGCSASTSPTSPTSCSRRSPLDREAYDRATSVYLPDRVIPMLPEIISNNLASLQPDKVRYALTAMMEMTPRKAFASRPMCSKARSKAAAGSRTKKSTNTLRQLATQRLEEES